MVYKALFLLFPLLVSQPGDGLGSCDSVGTAGRWSVCLQRERLAWDPYMTLNMYMAEPAPQISVSPLSTWPLQPWNHSPSPGSFRTQCTHLRAAPREGHVPALPPQSTITQPPSSLCLYPWLGLLQQ